MEPVQYVNKTGKLINDATKTNINLDDISIKNLILYNHLYQLYDRALEDYNNTVNEDVVTLEFLDKLKGYIHCLKKQINFYPDKEVSENCILTEVSEHIIQE